jgi:hypothetical protein
MVDLVVWSFVAATLLPVVLHICVRILSAVAGVLVWCSDRPVLWNRRPHGTFRFLFLAPASGRPENFKHGH